MNRTSLASIAAAAMLVPAASADSVFHFRLRAEIPLVCDVGVLAQSDTQLLLRQSCNAPHALRVWADGDDPKGLSISYRGRTAMVGSGAPAEFAFSTVENGVYAVGIHGLSTAGRALRVEIVPS